MIIAHFKKEQYDELSKQYAKLNLTQDELEDYLVKHYVKLADGSYITKIAYDKLPPELKYVADTKGLSSLKETIETKNIEQQKTFEIRRTEYEKQLVKYNASISAIASLEKYREGEKLRYRQVF
jgi:hypothetical protein